MQSAGNGVLLQTNIKTLTEERPVQTGMNVLAVGAHPDDVELGCGGSIVKHLERGDSVFVLVMTNGERGKHTPSREECITSLELLGVKKENIFFGNLPDGYLRDDHNTVSLIESYIKNFKVNRVYTHHYNDRHQDHRNCSNAVSSAARKIPEIFLFEAPSTKSSFEPHYFIELSFSNLTKKLDSLRCYKTQIEKGIVDVRMIEYLARLHGGRHQTEYAESFAINHLLRRGMDV